MVKLPKTLAAVGTHVNCKSPAVANSVNCWVTFRALEESYTNFSDVESQIAILASFL